MQGLQIFGLILLFALIGYLLGTILFGLVVSKLKNVDLRKQGSGNVGATNTLRAMGKAFGLLVMILDFFKSWFACFVCVLIYKEVMPLINKDLYNKLGMIVYISGLFAVIGHCFPIIYLCVLFKTKFDFEQANKYSGGKGASSAGGLIAAISPWIFIICFISFFIIVFISKYVSVSSMLGITMAPLMTLIPWLDYFYMMDIVNAGILNIPLVSQALEVVNEVSYIKNFEYLISIFFILVLSDVLVVYRHKANIKRLINKTESKIIGKNKNN